LEKLYNVFGLIFNPKKLQTLKNLKLSLGTYNEANIALCLLDERDIKSNKMNSNQIKIDWLL